ncbi:acyl- -binding domain-containing 6-like [Pelobates cultripes]|uniref:Acyl- -binding domain-containing 6-like n=1 Tax=Pelobates cultripes TaxID=61616 RepID=A0AAD1S7K1_PELCU|nr:acyl- -binding domain-containing 6-like [Pelobates cultripes]
MSLASGHWVQSNIGGNPPKPRYGHALTIAGNVAFIFGGCAISSIPDGEPVYLNDFHMLTITPNDSTWEEIPQSGHIPSPREGHDICVVKRQIYLFGGRSEQNADECLPGTYLFDIGTLTWELLKTSGAAPKTLNHSVAVVGENVFVFGGICHGRVVDDLFLFNTVSENWVPVKTSGCVPEARMGHRFVAVGEHIYMFGGCTGDSVYCNDTFMLDTASLVWKQCEVKGEKPSGRMYPTFTAHHDKDIYLFGGIQESDHGAKILKADIMKLSLAKMKWKVPLYFGIPPSCRYKHTAFVLHSQLFIFGGTNEETDFNDVMGMRLINPSDRQPIMKDILLECGIQGVSNGYTPTKIPKVKYNLTIPQPPSISFPAFISDIQDHSFTSIRKQAMEKITSAFALLDSEFEKFDLEKAKLAHAQTAFQQEKEEFNRQYKAQQQELQDMLEKHKAQNEAWLKARADENDKERKEICKLREDIFMEQKNLKEERQIVEKRNQQLITIMQQFKGM